MKTKLRMLAVALIAGGTMVARTRPAYDAPPAYAQNAPVVSSYRVAPRYAEPRDFRADRGDDRDGDRGYERGYDRDHDRGDRDHDNRGNGFRR